MICRISSILTGKQTNMTSLICLEMIMRLSPTSQTPSHLTYQGWVILGSPAGLSARVILCQISTSMRLEGRPLFRWRCRCWVICVLPRGRRMLWRGSWRIRSRLWNTHRSTFSAKASSWRLSRSREWWKITRQRSLIWLKQKKIAYWVTLSGLSQGLSRVLYLQSTNNLP